jgi:predicted lysophospholipase L1 biosynthesis ABC-type transport system permease subunit
VWLPTTVDARAAADPATPSFSVIGRLAPGVTANQARAEFAVIAQQVASLYPQYNREIEVAVKRLPERLFGEVATQTMYVMLGAVLLVLLVACINVANLLLVRAVYRAREIAIRAAIGAGRARIIRQLFLEALVLAVLGGALGVLVANVANAAMVQGAARRLPSWVEVRVDRVVLVFALLLTAVSAIGAAVLPAFKSTRGDLAATLYDASRGSTGFKVGRVMRGLIIAEIAFPLHSSRSPVSWCVAWATCRTCRSCSIGARVHGRGSLLRGTTRPNASSTSTRCKARSPLLPLQTVLRSRRRCRLRAVSSAL